MDIEGPTVQLNDGVYVNLLDPDYSQVSIVTFVRALSNICRFTGNSGHFYSVAEHCVEASLQVDRPFAWDTLLHDLSEAVLGDVSAPLKALLPKYRLLEKLHCERLAYRFNTRYPLTPSVRLADMRMLATERQQLMPPNGRWKALEGVLPYDITLRCLNPSQAFDAFMQRYRELSLL